MEFSLANLPSVELCIRRAVSKSQSEGKGTSGTDPFSEEARRREQERSFYKLSILVKQEALAKSWRGTEKRQTFWRARLKAF